MQRRAIGYRNTLRLCYRNQSANAVGELIIIIIIIIITIIVVTS
jgi:hypothetical protein